MTFDLEKLSVLVVEDTEPMRKLVSSVLTALGVGVIYTANEGEKGFEKFIWKDPDIVITDWHMKPINGIELIKKIRTHEDSPNHMVPIIMMTGFSAQKRVSEARDAGVTEFLVKPFSANDLALRIAHIINNPRNFVETPDFFGPDRRRRKSDDHEGPFRRNSDLRTENQLE